jgi:hypothetical protein
VQPARERHVRHIDAAKTEPIYWPETTEEAMKLLSTGVAIALAVATLGAPEVYAFSQQDINLNPNGGAQFSGPDQRMLLNNDSQRQAPAESDRMKRLDLGEGNFGLSFGGSNRGGYGSPKGDPRMGFTPGDIRNDDGGRTFFGGMPDHIGPN